jgi:hypothetical protein
MADGRVNCGRKWEESGRVCVVIQNLVVFGKT